MNKEQVARVLEDIAFILELKSENPFKVRAYQAAAVAIRNVAGDLAELAASGSLAEIKGIGKAIASNISEIVTTGSSLLLQELKADIPPVIFDLVTIPGLGPKKAFILQDMLGIQSVGELEYACRENRLVELKGFGEKTQRKILQGIEYVKKNKGQFLLVDISPVADKIAEYLAAHMAVKRAAVAGSIRRRSEIVRDIDIVLAAEDRQAAAEAVAAMPGITQVIAKDNRKVSAVLSTGMKLDVELTDELGFACALHAQTGSHEHLAQLRELAHTKGCSLDGDVWETAEGKRLQLDSETALYQVLDLPYIEPELREGRGEIQAAIEGRLPELVCEEDLRGVFHVHTRYSDGSHSLAEMAGAAQKRGWQYLGVADHSQSAFYANGLKRERIREQRREIDAWNEAQPSFRIFAGIECDILPDGSLDYPDDVLAEFDFIVASVHSAFRQSQADMTRRIIRAARNKYVTMLGHLTGRLLLAREAYAVDVPAVLTEAAETGTIMEINASPYRLDLDWRWHHQAKEQGIRFAINPDAHAIDELGYVTFGTAMARKGWLSADDIINTRDAKAVIRLLRQKRE